MATDDIRLMRSLTTRVHGAALVAYFVLLPYVVLWKWRLSDHQGHDLFVRSLLVVLALFWLGFLVQVTRNVGRLRRGRRVNAGGSAWLAGLVVALLALVVPTTGAPARAPSAHSTSYRTTSTPTAPAPRRGPATLSGLSSLPLALMAKRRGDLLRHAGDLDDVDVDESIDLLRASNPELLGELARRIGDTLDGVLEVTEPLEASPLDETLAPVVVCTLESTGDATRVGFAHEGGQLPIRASWSNDDIVERVVALHSGKVVYAQREDELLRLLATRTLRHTLVVYLGATNDLDDDLRACTITVTPYVDPTRRERLERAEPGLALSTELRVELLRADPVVTGLTEPFSPTLRRRCVEMTAYLALHRHEPVTGERLRTRVLTHADVDASMRTLANTASAVRRSLGSDARGPRLHPVTSSGLYVTHGLASDVEVFGSLIVRARQLDVEDAASLAHQALLLVKGEPLASALRGFEWFLAEGHGARLARDGEWAALALHHAALSRRNYELAFWALQQGLLIDPYSDALSDALSRVPRLREFGGDRRRRAQDQTVGAHGAVAMSWSLSSLSQQVFQ